MGQVEAMREQEMLKMQMQTAYRTGDHATADKIASRLMPDEAREVCMQHSAIPAPCTLLLLVRMQTAAGQHETCTMRPDVMHLQEQWRKQQVAEAPK